MNGFLVIPAVDAMTQHWGSLKLRPRPSLDQRQGLDNWQSLAFPLRGVRKPRLDPTNPLPTPQARKAGSNRAVGLALLFSSHHRHLLLLPLIYRDLFPNSFRHPLETAARSEPEGVATGGVFPL